MDMDCYHHHYRDQDVSKAIAGPFEPIQELLEVEVEVEDQDPDCRISQQQQYQYHRRRPCQSRPSPTSISRLHSAL